MRDAEQVSDLTQNIIVGRQTIYAVVDSSELVIGDVEPVEHIADLFEVD